MGLFDNIAKRFGYMRKSEAKPVKIVRVPDLKASTPYAPTIDKIQDILEFYASKMQNYSYAELSKKTSIVRNIQNKIVLDTTKEGFYIQSAYVKKCAHCGTEYKANVDKCDVCGSEEFIKPNDQNKEYLEKLIKNANVNSYSLKHEIKAVVLDLLRYDEGMILKQYEYSVMNNTLHKELKGVQRIVPINVYPNISQEGVLGAANIGVGAAQGFCPFHREKLVSLEKSLVCPECGTPLLTADYYALTTEGKNTKTYYNRDEIIRIPLFEQSSRFSLIETLGYKITSILAIDNLINDIYVARRYPNRALFFKTNNIDALIESNEKNKVELKKDRNYIPMFAVGSDTTTTGEFMKVVDMLGSIDELKLIELQDKYEKDIVSAYNCNIDPNTRQITADPEFIKEIQKTINSYVLDNITKSKDITDWSITLRPSQKEEEANELRLKGLKIQNATGMVNLGFDILDYDEERQEFIYTDKPVREPSSTFSSFSSNARGLEDTFGPMPGYDKLSSPKTDKK